MALTDGGGGRDASGSGTVLPETIDRYKVKRRLGRGGQASVYLAYDPNFDLDVAVKVLEGRRGDREFAQRFRTEARVAVRLNHPNIVRVYAYDPDYPFMAMEFCEGGDLTDIIMRRRRMPLREILRIVRKIGDALVAAHENEPPILHRDLKPANVLFSKGEPKVADFGLAKVLGDEQALTTIQGMMGTIRYMSPEQCADASHVDHRSDLWSLGVILYELLSWSRPFDKHGDSFVNIALKIRVEKPRRLPFDVPGPVAAVVERALEKERDSRFGSARELVAALDAALATLGADGDVLYPPETLISESDLLAARGAELLDEGKTDAARDILSQLRRLTPDASLVPYWNRRADAASTGLDGGVGASTQQRARDLGRALDEAETMLGRGDVLAAIARVESVLVEDPVNSVAQRLRKRLEVELAGGERPDSTSTPAPGLPDVVDAVQARRIETARHALEREFEVAETEFALSDGSPDATAVAAARDALDAARREAMNALATAMPGESGEESLTRARERLERARAAHRAAVDEESRAAVLQRREAQSRAKGAVARLADVPAEDRASVGIDLETWQRRFESLANAAPSDAPAAARASARDFAEIEGACEAGLALALEALRTRCLEAAAKARATGEHALVTLGERLGELLRSGERDSAILTREMAGLTSSLAALDSKKQSEDERVRSARARQDALEKAVRPIREILDRLDVSDEAIGKAGDPLAGVRERAARGEAQALAEIPAIVARGGNEAPAKSTWPPRLPPAPAHKASVGFRGAAWLPLIAGAVLTLAVVAGFAILGRGGAAAADTRQPIVFVAAGDSSVEITAARRDGVDVPELLGSVNQAGRSLSLVPGSYILETSVGSRSFTVPGATTVVFFDEGDGRIWNDLIEATMLAEGDAP